MHFLEQEARVESTITSGAISENGVVKRRTRNRAAKENALLAAAIKLFATKGYEATTTREIATVAGCAEGLIHRYFSGKAGLLLALVRKRMEQEVTDLSRIPSAASFVEEFVRLMEWEVDRMWEDRDFLRIIVPRALVDPALGKIFGEIVDSGRVEAISTRLKHFPEGQCLPDAEIKDLTHSIGALSFVFGFLRPAVVGRDRTTEGKIATRLANMLARNGLQR